MRTFPAFSFRAEHNRALFMRRFPDISFRRHRGPRNMEERGSQFPKYGIQPHAYPHRRTMERKLKNGQKGAQNLLTGRS
jgi:hypothetical protein